jgi:hypothetical protein
LRYAYIYDSQKIIRMIRKSIIIVIAAVMAGFINSCKLLPDSWVDAITGATLDFSQDGNSLYHQTDEVTLTAGELSITGEIKNAGKIDLKKYYKREVVLKESLFDIDSGIMFTGAYRYKGYSLFDLLHEYNLDKKNVGLFRPSIDSYVIVENSKGESVVFSWSEIFYNASPHQILIATEMAPIVPYKIEVDYPVGEKWRLVSAGDLFAFRMLEDPVKITVHSFDSKEYIINRELDPLYSPSVKVILEGEELHNITPQNSDAHNLTYYSNFFGMGMGYHHADNFAGPSLAKLLEGVLFPFDARLNSDALVCFASADGYRAIYSYSELFNRADQAAPILAITANQDDGGYYRNFLPGDFYADRSVKALKEMYIFFPR